MQKLKKELELPQGLVDMVTENVNVIKTLQAQIQTANQKIADIITGFALGQNVDITKEPVKFSDDFTKLLVMEEVPEVEEDTPTKTKVGKKVKM